MKSFITTFSLLLLSSCVGFLHQERLSVSEGQDQDSISRIALPHGYANVCSWPGGGYLRFRAPWGLEFSAGWQGDKPYDLVIFHVAKVRSCVQDESPNWSVALDFRHGKSNPLSARTERFIKHPGDGNPIDVTLEIEAHSGAGIHRSTHIIRFVPKLESGVIVFNPALDYT